MTSEQRLLIELADITGIEFECRSCSAKMLYPINKQDRLAEQCPNCYEPWFAREGTQNPNTPTTAEGLKALIVGLREFVKNPLIRARVRLSVEDTELQAKPRASESKV